MSVNQSNHRSLTKIDSLSRTRNKLVMATNTIEKIVENEHKVPIVPRTNYSNTIPNIPPYRPRGRSEDSVFRNKVNIRTSNSPSSQRNIVVSHRNIKDGNYIPQNTHKIMNDKREVSIDSPKHNYDELLDLIHNLQEKVASYEDNYTQIKNIWKVRDEFENIKKGKVNQKDFIDTTTSIKKEISSVDTQQNKKISELENKSKLIDNKIDKQYTVINAKVDNLEKDVATLKLVPTTPLANPQISKTDIDNINTKVDNIEKDVATLKLVPTTPLTNPQISKTDIDNINTKINNTNTELNKKISDSVTVLRNENNNLNTRIVQSERNIQTSKTQLDNMVIKTVAMNKDIGDIKKHIDILEKNTNKQLEIDVKRIGETDAKVVSMKKEYTVLHDALDKRITEVDNKLNNLKTIGVDTGSCDTDIKKYIEEDTERKIQAGIQKVQIERSERERELVKEQCELRDLITSTEAKLLSQINSAKTLVQTETVGNKRSTENNSVLMKKLEILEKEIVVLKERVGDVNTERRSRSNPRTRPYTVKEIDTHRLAEFPIFIAELKEEQVIEGGKELQNLLDTKYWEIITDTDKAYENGVFIAPFPGCYDINMIFKTISTSVTAQIYIEHLDSSGNIKKSYAMDQSSLVNDSTGILRLIDVNGGEGIRIRIQTKYNLALRETEKVDKLNKDGSRSIYDVVYNMIQIGYYPVRGFCEC